MRARTAQANQIRGLLAEFGMVAPKGIWYLERQVHELIEDAENELTGSFRLLIHRLMDHLKELDKQVRELEAQVRAWHRSDETSRRLVRVPGIGPLTASELVASVGDAKSFSSGRQLAAWLDLVPRQNSGGGKNVLLRRCRP
jgi:transposase